MIWFIDIFTSVEFWKIAVPAAAAIIVWHMNERQKLIWEQYKRKEENYKELIRCSEGFYAGNTKPELKSEFLNQVKLCWLYAPDEVINRAYAFLESVHQGSTNQEKALDAFRALMHSIRTDSLTRKPLKKTELTDKDFRHLKAN